MNLPLLNTGTHSIQILTNKPAAYAKYLIAKAGILGHSFGESEGSSFPVILNSNLLYPIHPLGESSGELETDINNWCVQVCTPTCPPPTSPSFYGYWLNIFKCTKKEKELTDDPQIFVRLKNSCLVFAETPGPDCLRKMSELLSDKDEFTIVILSYESRYIPPTSFLYVLCFLCISLHEPSIHSPGFIVILTTMRVCLFHMAH